jgi:predicted metal-dependent peptidase
MNQEEDLRKYLKEVDRAKLALMDRPSTTFYSSFLSMLNIRISREIPTAATDGLKIIYNPDFLEKITRPQLLGLTLHEVEHVVNGHCDYAVYENYCHDTLNIAQDHYINLRLLDMGYELPPGGYHDPQFKGLSSMEIYHKLIKNGKPQIKPELKDILRPPSGMTPEEHAERVLGNIVKAVILAEQSNDHGSVPGHLRRNLDDILSPKLPWTTILQQYLTEYVSEDYSMRRPNKRFMPAWYLPRIEGEGLGHLVLGCDVSGSMSEAMISEIWSEYSYIFETMNPKSAHIMTFDTKVHLDKTYEQGDFIPEFELEGGGGTIVQPLLDAIKEEDPAFAIIFTDGYFSAPNMADIDSDIFWIIIGNPQFTAPKGTVIHFE